MSNIRQLFYKHLGQTSDFPMALEIESATGMYQKDVNGKEYMDLIAGIGVSALGHSHPSILDAIDIQSKKYLHVMVYGEFIESPQVQLAHKLAETLPESLDNVFLVNSGSEATEGAIKLAKRYSGRSKIISCFNAYHGSTSGALSICGNEDLKISFRPLLPHIEFIRFGNLEDLTLIDDETAAIFIETIQGEAGVRKANKAYFQALRKRCNDMGVLLVLDEIQCGMGRTGSLWAFEEYDVSPDILLTAKGLGGGMPIGAFISSKEIMGTLTTDPILGHITTFGGNPVSAAAAIATINEINNDHLLNAVPEKEACFKELLRHEHIIEVRGKGLMLAVEFESFQILQKIIHHLLEMGVITDWFLFCDNSLRIAPPLIITMDEIKMACNKILQAIDIVYSDAD
ncbi:MAG: aspartate aminotransferase family protein [Reichenbachiella sp.]